MLRRHSGRHSDTPCHEPWPLRVRTTNSTLVGTVFWLLEILLQGREEEARCVQQGV